MLPQAQHAALYPGEITNHAANASIFRINPAHFRFLQPITEQMQDASREKKVLPGSCVENKLRELPNQGQENRMTSFVLAA